MDLYSISPHCEQRLSSAIIVLDQVYHRSTFACCFATVLTYVCKIGLYIFLWVSFHSFIWWIKFENLILKQKWKVILFSHYCIMSQGNGGKKAKDATWAAAAHLMPVNHWISELPFCLKKVGHTVKVLRIILSNYLKILSYPMHVCIYIHIHTPTQMLACVK